MTKEMDYFKSFCKISKAFGTTKKKQELLSLIVEHSIESMKGKAACLFLADERQEFFVPTAQAGLSEGYLHASPMKARQVVTVLEKEGFLSFPDATSDPRLDNHDAKKAEGIAYSDRKQISSTQILPARPPSSPPLKAKASPMARPGSNLAVPSPSQAG